MAPTQSSQPNDAKRLTLWDGILLVVGSMIGSGIFIVSADVIRNVGSAGWLVFAWVLTGIMTMTAAISYGELSAMYPKAGGQYVYLKESYNRLIAFLYGWSFFMVIQTGTIAAVGVAFSKFLAYLVPELGNEHLLFEIGGLPIYSGQLVAIIIIGFLTWVNTRGLKEGKFIQTLFTSAKVLALVLLVVCGFLLVKNSYWVENWQDAFNPFKLTNSNGEIEKTALSGSLFMGAMAAAMVGTIFSSDAWNNVTFIAGEIKNPQRNVGLSLFLGTLIVTLIYVAANLMYLNVMPLNKLAFPQDDRVAVAAANQIFPSFGTTLIAVLIMISTFGCNNGLILSGARVYYTMAQDGLFYKKAAQLNKNGVPGFALVAQFIVASLLCLSGKYGDLLDMISFVVVIFYVLTIIGLFILRKKQPHLERPYKAWGYPFLPILYIVLGLTFCLALIIYKPNYTWPGLIIVLLGIPVYFILKNKLSTQSSE